MIGESCKLYFELLTDDGIAEVLVLTKEVGEEEGDEIIMHALLRKNHDLDSRGMNLAGKTMLKRRVNSHLGNR